MKTFGAFAPTMMVAAGTLATGTLRGAHYTMLGDRSLALIHGGNDNSQTLTASLACELLSTQSIRTSSTQEDCDIVEDGTECIYCQLTNDNTQVPNSEGGPGVTLTSKLDQCGNGVGWDGYCWEGECSYWNDDYTCTGQPRVVYPEMPPPPGP